MPDANTSSKLLEPALPGAWIAEHRRIWQMDFLNADKLARFSHDRGAAYFNETDIIQLWQLGILKADLIISPRKLRLVGLTYRGIDFNGFHMYSDERQLPRWKGGWANARKPLKPLQRDRTTFSSIPLLCALSYWSNVGFACILYANVTSRELSSSVRNLSDRI